MLCWKDFRFFVVFRSRFLTTKENLHCDKMKRVHSNLRAYFTWILWCITHWTNKIECCFSFSHRLRRRSQRKKDNKLHSVPILCVLRFHSKRKSDRLVFDWDILLGLVPRSVWIIWRHKSDKYISIKLSFNSYTMKLIRCAFNSNGLVAVLLVSVRCLCVCVSPLINKIQWNLFSGTILTRFRTHYKAKRREKEKRLDTKRQNW